MNIKKTNFLNIVIVSVSFWLVSIYSLNISHDYNSYLLFYDLVVNTDGYFQLLSQTRFEPGVPSLYYYLSPYFSGRELFLLLALIILIVKYGLIIKYTKRPYLAWLLYIILFLPAQESSQIRIAFSTVFIMYIIFNPYTVRNLIPATVFSILFHKIGVITPLLLIPKLGRMGVLLWLLVFGITLQILDNISLLIGLEAYFIGGNHSVNLLSSVFIVQLLISINGLLNWQQYNVIQKKGLMIILIGCAVYIGLADVPGVAHRVREVSLIGIIPMIFSTKYSLNLKNSNFIIYIGTFYLVAYELFYTINRFMAGVWTL